MSESARDDEQALLTMTGERRIDEHGLDRLVACFAEVAGTALADVLDVCERRTIRFVWNFQLRLSEAHSG